ncbi:FadR/GntR family transcriptional regulator [Polymorphum gilvum]|uniref:Pyruvate dehydrogenase complex repressor n=1 Tax=Polymorphum gilvum (strain LMG 25793 / CGMCC 1.9160 / SL003B-26A1) TaxID=991905 RepID=F2J068_POLGS|nr:FCD domain-containing protein [Polymorphum gilvum]ADZ71903.1 Pyruvate dehydrogenase complex repressor [Polymorphum gilvum SL003B-26A1]
MFEKIRHMRTADAVVQQIEELILHGILRPGDRLPPERELVTLVDVSRPILRAALKTLEDRGLVVSRQGGGTFVADVIGTVFSEPIVDLIGRHGSAIEDYLDFRRDIEGIAAEHAAARMTAADREILTQIVADMDRAFSDDDYPSEARLDVDFHQAVGEAAHNIVLLHTLRACYRLLENGVFFNRTKLYSRPDARRCLLDQHREILDHLCAGDGAGARRAAEAHIDFVREALKASERSGFRDEVAELRLQQRLDTQGKRRKAEAQHKSKAETPQ